MRKNKKTKRRSPRPSRMSVGDAQSLIRLLEVAGRYFDHSDTEAVLGYQEAGYAKIDLQEAENYLRDNVVDPDGEGITAHDRGLIAKTLRRTGDMLKHPGLAEIAFALPASAIGQRLLEAAQHLTKRG